MISYEINDRIKVKSPTDLFTNLIETVTVHKFDEEAVTKFKMSFDRANTTKQPVIPVVIDSYGGQVYSLLAMIDIIKTAKVPVATIVQGKAMSCGAILFSCGTEGYRFVGSNSTIMIHDVSSFTGGKVSEIKADANEADRLNKKIYELMARNVGQSENYFFDIVHQKGHADWYLTPEDAVVHKLANHVRIPSFKVNVDVKIEFA